MKHNTSNSCALGASRLQHQAEALAYADAAGTIAPAHLAGLLSARTLHVGDHPGFSDAVFSDLQWPVATSDLSIAHEVPLD